jgi:hypothetical protein
LAGAKKLSHAAASSLPVNGLVFLFSMPLIILHIGSGRQRGILRGSALWFQKGQVYRLFPGQREERRRTFGFIQNQKEAERGKIDTPIY